jgi:hypothetical protein
MVSRWRITAQPVRWLRPNRWSGQGAWLYDWRMEAIGPVLIVLSLPLLWRWIPPNRFFGLRIPSALRNKSVWYDANALHARHLLSLGLLLVLLEFVLPLSLRIAVLRAVATAGFVAIVILDWRTANRLERQRTTAR